LLSVFLVIEKKNKNIFIFFQKKNLIKNKIKLFLFYFFVK